MSVLAELHDVARRLRMGEEYVERLRRERATLTRKARREHSEREVQQALGVSRAMLHRIAKR